MRVAAQIPLAEATTRFRIRRIVDSGPWEQRRVQRHDLNQVVAGVLKDANEVEQLSVVAQSRLEQRQPQLPAMLSKLAYRRLELQSPCGRVLAVEEPRTLQGLGLGVRGVQQDAAELFECSRHLGLGQLEAAEHVTRLDGQAVMLAVRIEIHGDRKRPAVESIEIRKAQRAREFDARRRHVLLLVRLLLVYPRLEQQGLNQVVA